MASKGGGGTCYIILVGALINLHRNTLSCKFQGYSYSNTVPVASSTADHVQSMCNKTTPIN